MQPCPKPSKVGFIMYNTHSLLIHELVNKVVKTTKKKQGQEIETPIQSEAAFQTDEKRRTFYKNFKRNDETQQLIHGHRKVPTVYTAPHYIHIVEIYLLSDL